VATWTLHGERSTPRSPEAARTEHCPLARRDPGRRRADPSLRLRGAGQGEEGHLRRDQHGRGHADDLVMELFCEGFWPGHPLGRPHPRTKKSVSGLRREHLAAYFSHGPTRAAKHRDRAAGHLEHGRVGELVRRSFLGASPRAPSRSGAAERRDGRERRRSRARRKELEQVHLCLGTVPCRQDHPDATRATCSTPCSWLDVVRALSERCARNAARLLDLLGHHLVLRCGPPASMPRGETSLESLREVIRLTLE